MASASLGTEGASSTQEIVITPLGRPQEQWTPWEFPLAQVTAKGGRHLEHPTTQRGTGPLQLTHTARFWGQIDTVLLTPCITVSRNTEG